MNLKLVTHHLPLLMRRRRLVPKLVRNYKRLLVDKKPVLRTVDFATTSKCMCKCEHCYAEPMAEPGRKSMSLAEKKSAIDQCLALGAVAINFVGGDPLCDRDLAELIGHIPPDEGISVITTSAAWLDDKVLGDLSDAGLSILCVSIDDPDAATHDTFRGYAGVFDKAVESLRLAKARGLECVINSVLTREQIEDGRAARLVDLAASLDAQINLTLPIPVGRWAGREPEVLPPPVMEEWKRLRAISHVRWDGQSNWLKEGCGAAKEKISITPAGDVLACAVIMLSFGNVRDEPLGVIWERMLANAEFKKERDHCPLSEDPEFIQRVLVPIENLGIGNPARAEDVLPAT
ncbi:MAG: radical SAM protein [Deltaproteobacteria bacterium]|nr:radical SAM protein [Deltaproteobacteria bacterium]